MNMKEVEFEIVISDAVERLQKGAFLTIKNQEKVNTMTIAWGMFGYIWSKPIIQVMIRKSRYSYEMLQDTNQFTISMPVKGGLKEELSFCGTKSGRDYDKINECNFSLVEAKKIKTPVIGECELHFECKIIAVQELKPEHLNEREKIACYANNDYHVMYYGEVLATYIKE